LPTSSVSGFEGERSKGARQCRGAGRGNEHDAGIRAPGGRKIAVPSFSHANVGGGGAELQSERVELKLEVVGPLRRGLGRREIREPLALAGYALGLGLQDPNRAPGGIEPSVTSFNVTSARSEARFTSSLTVSTSRA
jgi:hypothetical protein